MSGEVLYRKWRPPRFADIVGQGPITQTLTQAIATGRTAHAYLLCGPRGTGKTSTARVLAKALNCTMRPPGFGDPCGNCDACLAIERGNFVDLIEIDAASNRGIDEMRDLREKVRFLPTQGKYKVYIIDEAHALTNDAFNAFLKTLEEPPPHSVFILATTEPHRLPATIISRCQRYDFHRISPSDVAKRLAEIATAEGVDVSLEVLRTVSRAAGGSLRDATNMLDQLITSFGANVQIEQVRELLGIGGEERAVALVKHLLTSNTTAALELINTVASEGQDIRPLHRLTVDFLRAALLMKSGVKDSLELSKEAYTELSFAARNATIEHLLRALRLFGQVSLKFDQPSPLPLELATVELSLDPQPVIVAQVAPMTPAPVAAPAPQQAPPRPTQQPTYTSPQPHPQQAPAQPQPQRAQPTPAQGQRPPQAPAIARPVEPPPLVSIDPNAPVEERLVAAWPTILRALSRVPRRRFDVAALFRSSTKRQIIGTELLVRFTHTSNSERLQDELEDPRCRLEVERILEQALGASYTIKVETDSSRSTSNLNADQPGHLVRAAMSLGGQVIQNQTPTPEPPAPAAPAIEPPAAAAVDPLVAHDASPVPDDTPATPAIEPATVPVVDPAVAQDAAPVADDTPAAFAIEPETAATKNDEAPAMAQNLFNEMQAIPRPPPVDDLDNELMPAAALPSNQIPADYFPGPDEEEMNG
jgi:DNA polymerase-3 subunit gamma/tau